MILGILYLAFRAFSIVFGHNGFSVGSIGLSFLRIGVDMTCASSQQIWNRYHTGSYFFATTLTYLSRLTLEVIEKHGTTHLEFRLIMGQVGGVLIPVGFFWIAFATDTPAHRIVPIIAFGMGIVHSFTPTLTYLVTSYQPIAASVLASNSFTKIPSLARFRCLPRRRTRSREQSVRPRCVQA